MQYILDTAHIEDIKRAMEYYPIDGVTTNPTIISKEHSDFAGLIKGIRKIIGPDLALHVQTTGGVCADIVSEAVALKNFVGGNFYAKIPACEEGLKAIRVLSGMGINVTATAIFTQQQALLAAKAGAAFVAPYVNRLDNISSDGVGVVSDIVKIFDIHAIEARVLAASFKNVEQVHRITLNGVHAVTLSVELLSQLLYHPMTFQAIDDFNADWEAQYGKGRGILDLI